MTLYKIESVCWCFPDMNMGQRSPANVLEVTADPPGDEEDDDEDEDEDRPGVARGFRGLPLVGSAVHAPGARS